MSFLCNYLVILQLNCFFLSVYLAIYNELSNIAASFKTIRINSSNNSCVDLGI